MEEKRNLGLQLFKPKNFGMVIGLIVFLLFILISFTTNIFSRMETGILDLHYNLKNLKGRNLLQSGVSVETRDIQVSPDIVLVGIDNTTLDVYGRWPFSRSIHANFLDSLSRIKEQNDRESAVFLDVFFINPDTNSFNDVKLIQSIEDSQRVFLETVLSINPPSHTMPDIFDRQEALYQQSGSIIQVEGDTSEVELYYSAEPPLIPYGEAVLGYGHANFREDNDDVYRRQQLIARIAQELAVIDLNDLTVNYTVDRSSFERLSWLDKQGTWHDVELPLSEGGLESLVKEIHNQAPARLEDSDGDGQPDVEIFEVVHYQDRFVPSITLALAANYFNVDLEDIKVFLGDHILIENPRIYDTDGLTLVPYRIKTRESVLDEEFNIIEEAQYRDVPEIRIPIDESGQMLINFMGPRSNPGRGGYQTFPVRTYSTFSERVPPENPDLWPNTKNLGNDIVMVGGFFQGTDEKTTPWGLMYGVEIHANALNTIIMDNFLVEPPLWVEILILFAVVFLVAFYTSRMNTGLSLVITLVYLVGYFFFLDIFFFEEKNLLLDYATPALGAILTFVAVVIYRVVMEESDKRHLKDMFGKYVNPLVVDQMMEKPPVLGGIDMDITVFFSDIRSFTTLSESMSPQELVTLLNQYLTSMTDCMMDYTGTLDKYIGDAIMGFWGAPMVQVDHAKKACRSSLQQLELLQTLNESLPEHKRIRIGIGLNSGICTVGNMGSQGRMNYTCMGDNVNLASRLEAINKQYRTELIISEYTYEKIKDDTRFICRELDDIRVKGKRKPVRIYELVGFDGPLNGDSA